MTNKTVVGPSDFLEGMDESFRKFFNEFVQKYPEATLILYGSRANGKAKPKSDYDIIIVMKELQEERTKIAEKVRKMSNEIDLDVIVLRPDDLDMSYTKRRTRDGCVVLYNPLNVNPC